MRMQWSEEIERMEEILKPYFNEKKSGIREDSPQEIKELFNKFCDKIDEEDWL